MKKLAKSIVVAILGWQVRRLRKKQKFQVVAVAGSVGKTSTKHAIATVLQQKFRIQYQAGNYNDIVTVPLIFFGMDMPSLLNPIAWLATFIRIESQLRKPYPYDVVVVELGTDYPGNIPLFRKYLQADLAVLTAISAEHMEFFKDIDEVAAEELSVAQLSNKLIVNMDLIAPAYRAQVKVDASYGLNDAADYVIDADGTFKVTYNGQPVVTGITGIGHGPQRYSLGAATAVSHLLGLTPEEINVGLRTVQPMSGRGQRLAGINGSTIIDDTYNASPEAVKAALDFLYQEKATQKIAILGNMNELGAYSEAAHREAGAYCDPAKVNLVLTLGPDANKFLAPAAKAKGCEVRSYDSPYVLAADLAELIKPGALILAKGSQNRVFAEEAIKPLLANPQDQVKLVRQSKAWIKIKERQFGKPEPKTKS